MASADNEAMELALARLRRAQRQLCAVIAMTQAGGDCNDIVTGLAAVSRTLDRAGFTLVAAGMRHCVEKTDSAISQFLCDAELERLLMSLG